MLASHQSPIASICHHYIVGINLWYCERTRENKNPAQKDEAFLQKYLIDDGRRDGAAVLAKVVALVNPEEDRRRYGTPMGYWSIGLLSVSRLSSGLF